MLTESDLPDDPREACRAISRVAFEADGGSEGDPAIYAIKDFAAVMFSLTDGRDVVLDDNALTDALHRMAARASDAAERIDGDLGQIRKVARHGCGDFRELDADVAARRAAMEKGEEPPYSPTVSDVLAAHRILRALGQHWPLDRLAEQLKAEAEKDGGAPEKAAIELFSLGEMSTESRQEPQPVGGHVGG